MLLPILKTIPKLWLNWGGEPMKNRCVFYALIPWVFGFSAFAQESSATSRQNLSISDGNQMTMLARSSADYRVTAGDIYTLAYSAGSSSVTYVILVDSSYRIRVSNLGIVNGAGKTFMQLKTEVESVVTNNYPLSGVQLVLTQPSIFKIYVKGEVPAAAEISVWALSRLSSLVDVNTQISGNALSFLSLRDVSVRSSNGQTRVYDLFKARRLGDLSQDPYLRPGDEISFNRISRVVTINGGVERPGVYQLLEGENIKEMIEFYGGGFTPVADSTRIELVRVVNSNNIAGNKIFLTENDLEKNYALENYDVITVPIITLLQPVMFVEGAVVNDAGNINASSISTSNRLVIQFNVGETYSSLVRRNIKWFTMVSDTQNAYILRGNDNIPINLNPMIYDTSYRDEVRVQENDVLVIPFRQYFVTVAGAVRIPGRYPYIPDRDWEYYIGLAGGFAPGLNARKSVTITNLSGKRMRKTDAITPETTITARNNHFLYNFNQVAPVFTTVLSIVSTFLSIWAITTR
jgi:protein involved in polysaccharide export with SLBB domain